ncbi:MAG: hypothetical protein ABI298_01250 [Acidimicrobiales bacterium]
MPDKTIECPDCHEVNMPGTYRCARCGASQESDEQRAMRLAQIEQGRREAERDNVNYPRLRPTGSFNFRRNVDTMSNQRLRRIILTLGAMAVLLLVLSIVR